VTVTADCACGASLSIDDASELSTLAVMTQWYEAHGEHRVTEEEYRIKMHAIHRNLPG